MSRKVCSADSESALSVCEGFLKVIQLLLLLLAYFALSLNLIAIIQCENEYNKKSFYQISKDLGESMFSYKTLSCNAS
jgi:hypothetical protein